MKLYHISQTENQDYDTYSDAVVCANSEDEARMIHPRFGLNNNWNEMYKLDSYYCGWCRSPDSVTVVYIGEAAESVKIGIIVASFHAG